MKYNLEKDLIKTYLAIEKPDEINNSLYSLDLKENKITLKSSDQENREFQYDKIFTNKDENSYIYEEICLNTVQEFIKGMSFTFVSFGETNNKKLEFLVGDMAKNYKNINYHGILVRLIDNLFKKKLDKAFDYSIKISNFLVYDNNLIDLTFYGTKKSEKFKINMDLFLSSGFKITTDSSIIDKMNKIKVNDPHEIIKYLHHLMIFLDKIGRDIFCRANICFLVYLVDDIHEKTISTLNFIILCGSENLYAEEIHKFKSKVLNIEKDKNVIDTTKISIETRYLFESIINCVSNNDFINGNKKKILITKKVKY